MTISLNDRIRVRLTSAGLLVYRKRLSDVNRLAGREVFSEKAMSPDVDEDGCSEFSLWDFMNTFGPYIGPGMENVIEPIELEVVPKRPQKTPEDKSVDKERNNA